MRRGRCLQVLAETALPLPFAGIGLRESLVRALLGDVVGLPLVADALIGSAGLEMQTSWSLPRLVLLITLRLAERRQGLTGANAIGDSPPTSPA